MRPKLLIAEDDALIAESMRAAFDEAQFDVTVVHSGDSALEALTETQFDVVLTDLVMKDGGGLLVTGMSRLLQKVPNVMVVSGRFSVVGDVDTQETLRKLGAKRTFAKPADLDELVAAAKSLLDDAE